MASFLPFEQEGLYEIFRIPSFSVIYLHEIGERTERDVMTVVCTQLSVHTATLAMVGLQYLVTWMTVMIIGRYM